MLCSCPEVAASPRVHRFQVFIFFFSESSRCICNFFPQLQPVLFIYFLFSLLLLKCSKQHCLCWYFLLLRCKHKISHMPGSSKTCVSKIHMQKSKTTEYMQKYEHIKIMLILPFAFEARFNKEGIWTEIVKVLGLIPCNRKKLGFASCIHGKWNMLLNRGGCQILQM